MASSATPILLAPGCVGNHDSSLRSRINVYAIHPNAEAGNDFEAASGQHFRGHRVQTNQKSVESADIRRQRTPSQRLRLGEKLNLVTLLSQQVQGVLHKWTPNQNSVHGFHDRASGQLQASAASAIKRFLSKMRMIGEMLKIVFRIGLTLPLGLVVGSAFLEARSPIRFVDRSRESGLDRPIVYGGVEFQRYILETTGTGVASFDYDRDGRIDIFLISGSRLELSSDNPPTNLLYRNLGKGKFSDVTDASGLKRSGWGQAACVGDIDNDGWTDLCVTYYGEIVLYRNRGDGTFEDISESSRIGGEKRWNAGCTFLDYDHDADLDLFVANYVDYEEATRYEPGSSANCMWRGMGSDVWSAGTREVAQHHVSQQWGSHLQ